MAKVRIKDLPADGAPKQTDLIPIDLGSTRHATVKAVVESGRPTASKSEAETGVDASKSMTPLTTKQAIDAQVGAAYVPKTVKVNAGSGMSGGGSLSGDVTIGLTVENVDRLTKVDGIEAGAQVNTVASVAGKTGAVTLNAADVGAAPDTLVPDINDNTTARHTHSNKAILDAITASFSASEKTKLSGIEAGAQVNTVTSVSGKTGAVTLVKGDVGLGNVDNTSDANKPISTATQTALNAKANSSVTVSAGSGLTGGGNLTSNRSIALNAASIASLGKADTALQAPGGTTGQTLIKKSNDDNDVSWVSSEAATAVSYAPQILTLPQKFQARENLGLDKFISPQDFNEDAGESFNECSDSIQSAIDYAHDNGVFVIIPYGEYGVNKPLRLKSGVRIFADQRAHIKALSPTDIFRNFDEGGDYTGVEMNGWWVIDGGIWDNDCDNLASTKSLANIGKSSGWSIKNATFKNVKGGHVIDCAGNQNFTIKNIVIDGYNPLDRDFSEAIQIDKFSSVGFPVNITPSSFDDRPCSSGVIRNINAYSSGVVVGSHGGSADAYHKDIAIENIESHDALMTVVRGHYWDGANISNIVSHGASMPYSTIVRLDYCKNTKGVNFIGRGKTQGRGVYVSYGDNVHIDGVVVVEAGEVGIDFLSCLNSSLSNGLVKNAAENGIDFRDCTDTKDINSRVLSSGGVAVRSSACIRHTSLNATVSGDFVGGVSTNGGSDNLILNATVYDMNNSSKIGVQAAASASMPTIRNARIYGTAGQYGVLISGSVTNGWVDGCDLRGYSGAGKLTVNGTTPINTNNHV